MKIPRFSIKSRLSISGQTLRRTKSINTSTLLTRKDTLFSRSTDPFDVTWWIHLSFSITNTELLLTSTLSLHQDHTSTSATLIGIMGNHRTVKLHLPIIRYHRPVVVGGVSYVPLSLSPVGVVPSSFVVIWFWFNCKALQICGGYATATQRFAHIATGPSRCAAARLLMTDRWVGNINQSSCHIQSRMMRHLGFHQHIIINIAVVNGMHGCGHPRGAAVSDGKFLL